MNRSTRPRFSTTATATAVLLFAAMLFIGHTSRADSTDTWPIKFHPHLDLASTYDDNILISHSHQLADWSFTASPGLELDYGDLSHNFLTLDYTAGIERFLQHGSQDAENNYVTFKSEFNFTHLKLQAEHRFVDETSANTQAGARIHEQENLTDCSAEYLLGRLFSVGLIYHQEIYHYVTPGQIDNSQFEPGVALYYHVLPKTDLYTEFDYGWVDVDQGENQVFESASVGVRGKITSRISGRIGVGYENRDYSGPTSSVEAMVANVSLHGDFAHHTSADLIVLRQINPSITVQDTSYTATRVESRVSHSFYKQKFVASAGGAYENDDYNPNEDRIDNIWQGTTSLRYIATKRVDVGVAYRYQHDVSNVGTFSFSQNVVTFDAHIHF